VPHDAATVTLPARTPAHILRYNLPLETAQSSDPTNRTVPVTFGVSTPARPFLHAARYLALLLSMSEFGCTATCRFVVVCRGTRTPEVFECVCTDRQIG
jgi:hypothetical protein